MNDYHDNTTTYGYDGEGKLTRLTAPGSTVWAYAYDDLKRLTQVSLPNGMTTNYLFDDTGRQTAIHHQDGATVVQGFDYQFDLGENITRITHEDNAYWAYAYDGRNRLTLAERYDNTPTLLHRFTYAYDAGAAGWHEDEVSYGASGLFSLSPDRNLAHPFVRRLRR